MTRRIRIRMVIAGSVLMLLGLLAVWGGVESFRTQPVTTKICRCVATENGRIEQDRPCPPTSDPVVYETVCREVRHGGPQPAILVTGAFLLVMAIAVTRLGLLGDRLDERLQAPKDEYGGYQRLAFEPGVQPLTDSLLKT